MGNRGPEKKIEMWKSEFLGPFCLEYCSGDCCKKWPIAFYEESEPLFPEGSYTKFNGVCLMDPPCPLQDSDAGACTVHDDPRRPDDCKDFPIYECDSNSIGLSNECTIFQQYKTNSVAKKAIDKLQEICEEFDKKLVIS